MVPPSSGRTGESHGRRSLVGCSPCGHEQSDMTEQLHFHFSLSCIGEGNGNPLQCSCLENPGDGGAWWAAIYGVTKSRTRLKRLSSSSNILEMYIFYDIVHLYRCLREGLMHTESAGVLPQWFQGIRRGDGIGKENLFIQKYKRN